MQNDGDEKGTLEEHIPWKGALSETTETKEQHTLLVNEGWIIRSTMAKNTKRTEVPSPLPAPMWTASSCLFRLGALERVT